MSPQEKSSETVILYFFQKTVFLSYASWFTFEDFLSSEMDGKKNILELTT